MFVSFFLFNSRKCAQHCWVTGSRKLSSTCLNHYKWVSGFDESIKERRLYSLCWGCISFSSIVEDREFSFLHQHRPDCTQSMFRELLYWIFNLAEWKHEGLLIWHFLLFKGLNVPIIEQVIWVTGNRSEPPHFFLFYFYVTVTALWLVKETQRPGVCSLCGETSF